MSGAKFYIWGGGRWREVNTASGEVAGWSRRARFVFARRGRLRMATRRRVLAALQAHVANLPSSVQLGPRLSVLSNEPVSAPAVKAPQNAQPVTCGYHHCCVYSHGFHNNNFVKHSHNVAPLSNDCFTLNGATTIPGRREVSTQHDAAIRHVPREHPTLTINLASTTFSRKQIPLTHKYYPDDSDNPVTARINHPPLDQLLTKPASSAKRRRSVISDSDDSERHFRTVTKTRCSENGERSKDSLSYRSSSTISELSGEVCKELTISESDVMALRSYVARTRSAALERFDADDEYKRMLFYAINPLVEVRRCPATERALRSAAALPHFAARLGLEPATPNPHADKENIHSERHSVPAEKSFDSDDDLQLFQYSSRNKSARTKKDNLRKNIRDLAPLQRTFKNKRLESRNNETIDKNCDSSRLRTYTKSNCNQTSEKEFEPSNKSNDRRGTTSRHKAVARREHNTEGSDSADQFRTLHKGRRENRASNDNKRKSWRHKTVIHHKLNTGDNESDENHETHKKNENRPVGDAPKLATQRTYSSYSSNSERNETRTKTQGEGAKGASNEKRSSLRTRTVARHRTNTEDFARERGREPSDNKRRSLRQTTATQPTYILGSSDSDRDKPRSRNQGESAKSASNEKRGSLRTRTVARHQTNTDFASERGREPSDNKRRSLRHTKTYKQDTNNDKKRATSYSSRQNRHRSVLPLTKNYIEQSSSDGESRSLLTKAVAGNKYSGSPAKNALNTRLSPAGLSTADGSGVSKLVNKLGKPLSELVNHKTRRESAVTEAGPSVTVDTHTISKRASSGKMKEYSNLEDHAIVAWVSGGGRARRVNGNALWRDLQEQYAKLTGMSRSWHSLRNRYLRYILPGLGALALPPPTVQRLRAAAATGSMKRRGAVARRPSIFEQSMVRTASIRPRPRPPTPTIAHNGLAASSSDEGAGPSRRGDVTSETRAGPSRRRDVTSETRAGPSRRRDVTSETRAGPSRRRDVASETRAGPSRRGDVTSETRAGPERDTSDDEGDVRGARRLRRSRASAAPSGPSAPSAPSSPFRRTRKLFNPKLVL